MIRVATSVICCFSSLADAAGSGMCTIGNVVPAATGEEMGAAGVVGAATCTGGTVVALGGTVDGVTEETSDDALATGGRCVTGRIPTVLSTRSVSTVAMPAETWAAVTNVTEARWLIESRWLATCAALIPVWSTPGSSRARMAEVVEVPHTLLGGLSTSMVSRATIASSGLAWAASVPSAVGPTDADQATAVASRPRVRVARRNSTETIDGGSGDWRNRPVIVWLAPTKMRGCTGAGEGTR